MKISIVIPAFNEERLLAETLRHINQARTAFDALAVESELIVCDNNSTDRTAEIARAAGATVVFEPVNQIGRARNTGAAAASGEWVIFVDADTHPSAGLLTEVVETIRIGKVLAGGCVIRLQGEHRVARCVTWFWNCVSRSRRLVAGSFIFVDAAAFRQVGGFDQQFYAGEELDLAKRLHRLARATGREIVILHRHPILTSDRKVRLYSPWEHLRFFIRGVFSPRRVLRDKEACHAWYDGRR